MKLLFATYGTEGDTRPFAALSSYLMRSGHDVLLLADSETLGSARALGVPVRAIAGDIKGALGVDGSIARIVGDASGLRQTAQALAAIANAQAASWLSEFVAAAEGRDAIVVSGLAAFAGFSAAEHLGIRAIGAGLIPITPTAEFASPFLPQRMSSRLLNRAGHRFVNAMLWRAFRKATNAARKEVCGMSARQSVWEGHPMLYGISPNIVPIPADWPDNAHNCGQWIVSAPDFIPDTQLVDFLDSDEPPVYVGFGSMLGFDADALLKELVSALGNRRVLFNAGWSKFDLAKLPSNILPVGDTPHDWLFPRVSVAIHHGGSGTSHSAVRAGIPSVVIPFAGDQAFWGCRLEEAGVGSSLGNGRNVSATKLRKHMAIAESTAVKERAAQLGHQVTSENGLAVAAGLLERYVV
jgi:sterol 3beta-glucosyltransferase